MYRYQIETQVSATPAQLFAAKLNIADWPRWDQGLEATGIDVPVQEGAAFWLRPQGGPTVRMLIETLIAPHCFSDVAVLMGARLRTRSEFIANAQGTLVRETLECWGPLAWLWNRLLVRKLAAGAADEIRTFAGYVVAQS
ncbi:hypothetical protein SAMN02745857_03711 [Andreprevotia lacus DSM 23236]|uniref:Polyketide cyclase / dehydrase and lipid transport n=1 Tax=Andreprevotia lacus DSM 23236 TaxID=1121001 RepID=A0A1W1Y0G5_9NEIS|nr:hypothetical protein [Andreprevotia lacus]SMC29238.1 hypothetical protein SAMN02745857_03711 [Andreprevotia lacus DSM 23236]